MFPRICQQDCGIARRCKLFLGTELERGPLFLGTELERGPMVQEDPSVWPSGNAAGNSQRQVCKQSLTLGESITCDRLCLASRLFPRKGGALGLVQEFISGEALEEYALKFNFDRRIYKDPESPRASSTFTIHGYGKVHRDIKPRNLKFDSENVVKILDFVAPIASTRTIVYRNARGA